jgi:hypothetical protein
VTATANDPRLEDAFGQVTHWFFDDYAVLADPLFTQSQAEALRGWVMASGKNLVAVYMP